jgi:hypothetical protein
MWIAESFRLQKGNNDEERDNSIYEMGNRGRETELRTEKRRRDRGQAGEGYGRQGTEDRGTVDGRQKNRGQEQWNRAREQGTKERGTWDVRQRNRGQEQWNKAREQGTKGHKGKEYR